MDRGAPVSEVARRAERIGTKMCRRACCRRSLFMPSSGLGGVPGVSRTERRAKENRERGAALCDTKLCQTWGQKGTNMYREASNGRPSEV